jgi:hypothetical protein
MSAKPGTKRNPTDRMGGVVAAALVGLEIKTLGMMCLPQNV